MLYIPHGFPHEGYALENALNYSVGFRALRVGDDNYVNGEKIVTPHREAAAALAARYDISREQLGDTLEDPSFLALLAGLINSGYWYFKN